MPIYEYQCKHCGFEDSFLESMNAPKSKKCPQCKTARAFVRLVSAAGFQLKGQGWYQTDFKNPPKSAAAKDKSDGDKNGDDSTAKKDGDGGDKKNGDKKESSGSNNDTVAADKKPSAKAEKK